MLISFYLDVDGRRYPRPSDYAPRLDHLMRDAREQAHARGPGVVQSVEKDLQRIARWLEGALDRSSTRGVAAFSACAQGLFRVFPLPVPVRDQIVVDVAPDLAQLAELLASTRPALVVLVDGQRSRLLLVTPGEAKERRAPTDVIARQADTDVEIGSFEHRHEELVRQHLRHVAHAVTAEFDAEDVRQLVLSGPHDLVVQLEARLPKRVRALVSARMALPVTTRAADVAQEANQALAEVDRRQRQALVRKVKELADEGAGAVIGLAATLEALSENRVETLLVGRGFAVPGARCATCDALLEQVVVCPRCGGLPVPVENIVDAAITEAFLRHVSLAICEADDVADIASVGAFERR